MLTDKYSQRFQELQKKSETLPFIEKHRVVRVPSGNWENWATSVQNLIKAVFGENSPHYVNFTKTLDQCTGDKSRINSLQGIFKSAKEDFEGGYVFNVDLTISGEVFGDFIVLAKQSLSEGYKDVAAVLASAALEDSLKRYALVNGLNVENKQMTEVINALKSKGLVSGAQKSLLDAMPKIRNFALHADWEKISEPDVNSIIGYVEQFLLSKFTLDT